MNQSKTFEEIDAKLKADLRKIDQEIFEIEEFARAGEKMLEVQLHLKDEKIVAKYQADIAEIRKGLEMFLSLKDEIENTISKLHETKNKAEEYIKQ